MKYMGSKNRIAKEIIPLILEKYKEGMIFIDACVGGANIIDKIPSNIPRYGNVPIKIQKLMRKVSRSKPIDYAKISSDRNSVKDKICDLFRQSIDVPCDCMD